MDIISIIPARGGSKGVPRKNIKLLNGKPLIYYSIVASNSCHHVNRTFVSTEDDEILDISKKLGADVIKRPLNLANDTSSSIDVIIHVLDYLEDKNMLPKMFVLLQPTSPLRTSNDIGRAIELFKAEDCDSLVSVCELNHQALLNFSLKNGYLVQNTDKNLFNFRRQDMPIYYVLNGAIYIATPEFIRKNRSFYGDKTIAYLMPKERSMDLDSPLDFKIVDYLLRCENE